MPAQSTTTEGVTLASADYAAILRCRQPLIDVRSPVEFAKGGVPGAVNLPLLNDEERAAVGRTYKERGREAAVALGSRLVSGATRDVRLRAWRGFAVSHPDALICCWRGGLRSRIVQGWLAEGGVVRPRVSGGFKALRRFCLGVLQSAGERRFVLVGGRTGSGKTGVVRAASNHIDLEALANHRGSAFGGYPTPQPTPIAFENALATALVGLDAHTSVVVEDESRTIGRLAIPEGLYDALQSAPIAIIEVGTEQRIDNIYQEYVVADADHASERLPRALKRIERRLGGVRYREIAALMAQAFDTASASRHRQWIAWLLEYYYDPMYDYQLKRKAGRVAMRGDVSEVTAYLENLR